MEIPAISSFMPSFEDVRKIFEFWFDQEGKWFYFELQTIQIASQSKTIHVPSNFARTASAEEETRQFHIYLQERVVGKILDIVSFPPSLLLQDTMVCLVELNYKYQKSISVTSKENRPKYGLVFSQITYYEPINNIDDFRKNDLRIKDMQNFS